MSLEEMWFVEQLRHLKSNTQVTKVVINEDGIEKKNQNLKKTFPTKKIKNKRRCDKSISGFRNSRCPVSDSTNTCKLVITTVIIALQLPR